MVEPTEAQVAAFKQAWLEEDERARQRREDLDLSGKSFYRVYQEGDRVRAGLRAALPETQFTDDEMSTLLAWYSVIEEHAEYDSDEVKLHDKVWHILRDKGYSL